MTAKGMRSLAVFFVYLSLYLGSFAVLQGPSDPDVVASARPMVGTALYFLSFTIALLSWGNWLKRALKLDFESEFVGQLAIGSAWLSLAAGAFGAFGLIGFGYGFVLQIFLSLGVLLNLAGKKDEIRVSSDPSREAAASERSSVDRWVCWLFIAFFVAHFAKRFLMAALLHGGTDPLMYHMLAPRYWVELGAISFAHHHPMTIHASFWEYLFIWPSAILGAPGGRGLVEAQYFNQWLHQLSAIGILFATERFFRPYIKNRGLILAGIAIAFTNSHFFNATITAKNDFGIAFWSIAAALMMRNIKSSDRIGHAVAGVLLAMVFLGKTVSVFSLVMLIGVSALIWANARREGASLGEEFRSRLLWIALGALGVALPELYRNWFATGNPLPGVFPITMKPEWASPHLYSFMKTTAPRLARPYYFLSQAYELFAENFVHWLSVLLIFPLFRFFGKLDARNRMMTNIALLCVVSCLMYCMGAYGVRFYRWLGASLVFLPVCALGIADLCFEELSKRMNARFLRYVSVCLALGTLGLVAIRDSSTIDLSRIAREVVRSKPALDLRLTRTFEGGDSLAWLRLNVPSSTLVGTTGDLMLYYVSHLRVSPMTAHPILDRELSKNALTDDLVKRAWQLGMRYVLDVDHRVKKNYSRYGEIFNYLLDLHPLALAYEGPDSRVIDLDRLVGEMFGACFVDSDSDLVKRLSIFGWLDVSDWGAEPRLTN